MKIELDKVDLIEGKNAFDNMRDNWPQAEQVWQLIRQRLSAGEGGAITGQIRKAILAARERNKPKGVT